uniref:Uncharacterized protein n=1 Tax=Leersia perrieri TaxID=77586 RepID=A0A0D9Y063_9ORYZ
MGSGCGGGGDGSGAAREEEQRGGGGMRRARVYVRAPHGAGALLIVGGAIVGAAVFAWCRRRRDGGGKNDGGEKHKKEEGLDGGVVEDEQADAQKLRQIYEDLSRDDNIEVGINGSDGKATEELYQIHKDDEIVPYESVSEAADKYDHNSVRECTEFTAEVSPSVEKYCHNSDRECAEITANGMHTKSVTENDKNSSKNGVENEVTDIEGVENSDDSTLILSSPDVAHEEHDNHISAAQDTTSAETTATAECMTHREQFSEVKMTETAEVKPAEEIETTPISETAEETETAQLDETAEVKPAEETENLAMAETVELKLTEETVAMAETVEVKLTEAIAMAESTELKLAEETETTAVAQTTEVKMEEENEFEQEEEKTKEELVEPESSPAYSSMPSLLKRTEKKVNSGWNETGMKLEQDFTNGNLKEHELTKGGAISTMVRRTDSMAILALMFAVTIAITIVMRLYVPSQAT